MTTVGYLFSNGSGLFDGAMPGAIITKNDDQPPWIIVDHKLEQIMPSFWPGRLWQVRVIKRLEPQGHVGHYTRALSVQIMREFEPKLLFGHHGALVSRVINAAKTLSLQQAEGLMSERSPFAADLYSAGWTRWLGSVGENNSVDDKGFSRVLALSNQKSRSPIGNGLNLVHNHVFDAAQSLEGEKAMSREEDGVSLLDPWAQASDAMCEAAMGFGVPDLFSPDEASVLLRPWSAVFGV